MTLTTGKFAGTRWSVWRVRRRKVADGYISRYTSIGTTPTLEEAHAIAAELGPGRFRLGSPDGKTQVKVQVK